MTSICLAMIVKDEAGVIERCLASVRGLIDRWVICDTGSTDDTPARIERALAGIPGELHHRLWIDFSHNRNELLDLAAEHADYLLLLDADMTVQTDPGGLEDLSADAYLIRLAGDTEHWMPYLVRTGPSWRYVGTTHEHLSCDEPHSTERLDGLLIHHHADGGTRPVKLRRDLALLTSAIEQNPDDVRTMFYLAQTYRDLGHRDEAMDWYRRRVGAGGWEEEVFYAAYQLGLLLVEVDWDLAVSALLEAWNRRPTRAEPLLHLARGYRERERWPLAYLFAGLGAEIPLPDDILFVERWVYEWGLPLEVSIAAHWRGWYEDAIEACHRILTCDAVPDDVRRRAEANRRSSVAALERSM